MTTTQAAPSEMLLLDRARKGSREAFGSLMNVYGRRIYRAIYFIVKNLDDAQDLTQETFYRALRSFDRFDPARPLYPWLHRIARNLAYNHVGRSERRNVSLPEEDVVVDPGEDPTLGVIRDEESAALHRALAKLSDDHREIITLKHFENCSYAEMADVLEIPIGTVMSRLYNARMKLKSILTEEA